MRSEKIDIVKCIGIVAVVCGHAGLGTTFVSQFHMPLFAFISGYLFADKYANSLKGVGKYTLKKIKTIYVPFIIFEFLFLAFHNLLFKLGLISSVSGQSAYTPKDFLNQAIRIITLGGGERLVGQLWYLISLFEITIIFCVIIYFKKKIDKLTNEIVGISFVIVIVVGLYFAAQYIKMPRQLNVSFVLLVFYAIGYFTKNKLKNNYREAVKKYKYIIGLLMIAIIINCMRFSDAWTNNTYYLIALVSAACGIVLSFCLAEIIYCFIKGKIKNAIIYIGQSTLNILVFHAFFIGIVQYVYVRIANLPHKLAGSWPPVNGGILLAIIYVIVGITLSLLVNEIIRRGKRKVNEIIKA